MTTVREAREVLVDVTDFAYQMGFHELGYNPIDTYRAALLAAVRATVEGMMGQHDADCSTRHSAEPNYPFCDCGVANHNSTLLLVLAALDTIPEDA